MNEFINDCLDMDEWKHSWHNKLESIEDYERARKVIAKKIADRNNDISDLNSCIKKIDEIIDRRRCMAVGA